jgi:hypothetical protein
MSLQGMEISQALGRGAMEVVGGNTAFANSVRSSIADMIVQPVEMQPGMPVSRAVGSAVEMHGNSKFIQHLIAGGIVGATTDVTIFKGAILDAVVVAQREADATRPAAVHVSGNLDADKREASMASREQEEANAIGQKARQTVQSAPAKPPKMGK